MPYKKEYHATLVHFMEFFHGGVIYDAKRETFTRDQLLEIQPNDLKRYFGMLAYGDPDYDINKGHRPVHARSSCISQYKKAISYYMPNRVATWCNGQGNPTKSAECNDIIKEIKKFEVRGEGCPPNDKRPLRENEFRKTIELLKALESFDHHYKYPTMCLWQYHLICRIDDVVHFEREDPRGHPDFDFALRTRVRWSKNVMEERRCPDQILLGSMDSEYCLLLQLGIWLEESVRRYPQAKYLFCCDDDRPSAPNKLKANHRNNLERHVWKKEEFQDLQDEDDDDKGIGCHSYRKYPSNEARRRGALPDEIEIRGRWKTQGHRVVFRYIDVRQLFIDAKVAGMLCVGGPIRYKMKDQFAAQITDDWLFTHVCPHIRQRYSRDRRLCKVLGTALLYAYCHLELRQRLPEHVRIRIQGAIDGVGIDFGGDNIVEKIPLNIYQVSGNLVIEDIVGGNHGGQAAAAGTGGQQLNGGGSHQLLQGILLQVGQTRQAVSLLHMHVDNQFQAMKTWQQRQNVLINSNIRRFGGTIQGAFARQDPQQAANRRDAAAQQQQPALEDGTAELSACPRTLMDLWHEWKFGLGNRKPAEQFTARERGGNGDKRKKQKYYRRKKVWVIMEKLVREGSTPQEACHKIRTAYGMRLSVTQIINKVIKEGIHPNLIGPGIPQRVDARA